MEKKIGENVSSGAEKVERIERERTRPQTDAPEKAQHERQPDGAGAKGAPSKKKETETAAERERRAAQTRFEAAKTRAARKEARQTERAKSRQKQLSCRLEARQKRAEVRAAKRGARTEQSAKRAARREMLANESRAEREKRLLREKRESKHTLKFVSYGSKGIDIGFILILVEFCVIGDKRDIGAQRQHFFNAFFLVGEMVFFQCGVGTRKRRRIYQKVGSFPHHCHGSVIEIAHGIAAHSYVAGFLEFKRAFKCYGISYAARKRKSVFHVLKLKSGNVGKLIRLFCVSGNTFVKRGVFFDKISAFTECTGKHKESVKLSRKSFGCGNADFLAGI